MTALQKVNLGTPPTGADGDTVRTANTKANANIDVLSTQATLTSLSPNAVRDLTAADMGKRINFTPTADATVHFAAANTTGVDQIVSVHNLSPTYDITMSVAASSGDTAPTIAVIKPGELLTYETDGVSIWRTIGRKKALDEVVQGKLSVVGALTASGAVAASGALSGQSLGIGAVASISATGAYSGASASYSGNVTVGGTLGVTGQATFTLRPVFGANTPWDSGNFNPSTKANLSGANAFDTRPTFAGKTPWDSGNLPSPQAALGYTPINKAGDSGIGALNVNSITTANYIVGGGGVLLMYDNGGTGSIGFRTGGPYKYFSLDAGGNGTALNGSWVNGSDARLKTNIETIDDALSKVCSMRGVYYEKKDAPGVRCVGVIAQEVQAEFPEAVHSIKSTRPNTEGPVQPVEDYLGVSYGNLVGPLIEAVKILTSRVEELEARGRT
ncbi:tail fiber domain-containing protein [Paraburkholderia sp. CNPSo 3272]|uniref:tail fiber domain-containing protein n=1 Tax=Paraburkholderia sp. CNPSo 3272 TaxID=2940931 RepID=UPI0020B7C34B|nr:tail fiber domain-containing protein [Paraburkholderia sp. CNPSo 3272]MCP3721725.1 tail fiber domain-containing protein [Paraburkholderia sp. CNPSo 3272]